MFRLLCFVLFVGVLVGHTEASSFTQTYLPHIPLFPRRPNTCVKVNLLNYKSLEVTLHPLILDVKCYPYQYSHSVDKPRFINCWKDRTYHFYYDILLSLGNDTIVHLPFKLRTVGEKQNKTITEGFTEASWVPDCANADSSPVLSVVLMVLSVLAVILCVW